MGNGKSQHFVFISNNSGTTVRVIIAPHKKWKMADLLFGSSTISISGLSRDMETIEDIWQIWLEAVESRDTKLQAELFEKVHVLFMKYGISIEHNFSKNIYDKALDNPLDYLTSAGWATLCASQEFCITLLIEDSKSVLRMTQFETLEDWAWIVNQNYVTKSKQDTLWNAAMYSGYPFSTLKYPERKKRVR